MFRKQSEEQIVSWVHKNQLDDLGSYLLSGTIHGKPGVPVVELGRIEKILKKCFSVEKQYQIGKKLLRRPEYTVRNIGAHLIVSGWPKHKEVESLIRLAADDDDWIVREYAAGAFASLLEIDFSHFAKLYLKWVTSESVNVKRAIALAVKYESKHGEAKKWKSYIDLINPLMHEEAEYIRKNLGPFAIGDGLLSRYPNQVMGSCMKWTKSKNENVRWNTAMIFTAAAARKFAHEGKAILLPLERDSSPFVSRAAKRAMKNLMRK